jgi:UDP-N-acetylglucosamine 2-epimerase
LKNKKAILVIGTRPELIKVAPVVHRLKSQGIREFLVVNTGQHRELLDIYWQTFDLKPDFNLNIISPGQDLATLTSRALLALNQLLLELATSTNPPAVVLAQGDTTTVMATASAAFYQRIPFVHLEAGLRSHDLDQPFPEEFNRRVASIVASDHLTPTPGARENLLREGIDSSRISVVGNTVVDAIQLIRSSPLFERPSFRDERLRNAWTAQQRFVLVTCHRRENQNQNLLNLLGAIERISASRPDLTFVWPVHENPRIKEVVLASGIARRPNVLLTAPMEYIELLQVLSRSEIVLTDSGGIQEEAPSFQVPVLILRDKTERPEAITAGISKLVGCDQERICLEFQQFRPTFAPGIQNPYGDGQASSRVVSVLQKYL